MSVTTDGRRGSHTSEMRNSSTFRTPCDGLNPPTIGYAAKAASTASAAGRAAAAGVVAGVAAGRARVAPASTDAPALARRLRRLIRRSPFVVVRAWFLRPL